jgi:hypothetical protein
VHLEVSDALLRDVDLLLAIGPESEIRRRRAGQLDAVDDLASAAQNGHVALSNDGAVEVAVLAERHPVAAPETVGLRRVEEVSE